MSPNDPAPRSSSPSKAHGAAFDTSWLRERVTLTVPRWTILAAGAAALALTLIALD